MAGSNRLVHLTCEPATFLLIWREVVVCRMGPVGVVFGDVCGHGIPELAHGSVASSEEFFGLDGLEERLAYRVVVGIVGFGEGALDLELMEHSCEAE